MDSINYGNSGMVTMMDILTAKLITLLEFLEEFVVIRNAKLPLDCVVAWPKVLRWPFPCV